MMRSSSNQGGVVDAVTPLENGLPSKEGEDERSRNVRELAAEVVEDVVQRAAEAAQEKSYPGRRFSTKNRGCGLQRLPTIQIDTVASPPPSPPDEPVDESEIQIDLDSSEHGSDEDLKEFLQSYVKDLLRRAMVLAEKKLQFASVTNDEELPTKEPEPVSDPELCNVAKKAVEEVIAKATVTVAERLESNAPELNFVDLPRIQIDSAPSSPEPKDKFDEKNGLIGVKVEEKLMTFGDAPEEVKDTAMAFVKEILRRAAAMLEEKSVPTVPFNFEDVDLMKNSGPWYVRVREALIRLLRTACFCTPRRTDS